MAAGGQRAPRTLGEEGKARLHRARGQLRGKLRDQAAELDIAAEAHV